MRDIRIHAVAILPAVLYGRECVHAPLQGGKLGLRVCQDQLHECGVVIHFADPCRHFGRASFDRHRNAVVSADDLIVPVPRPDADGVAGSELPGANVLAKKAGAPYVGGSGIGTGWAV